MPSMRKIGNVDVSALKAQIDAHPELWNANEMRTRMFADSPHREVDDIWLRCNAWENFNPENPGSFADEHKSVDYPALDLLTSAREIIKRLLNNGDELGVILLTRIPPGKQVYPHSDAGRWHSEYYETKVLVLVQSHEAQAFVFMKDEIDPLQQAYYGEAGDVFEFNNHVMHAVYNNSNIDRISLIAAVRRKI